MWGRFRMRWPSQARQAAPPSRPTRGIRRSQRGTAGCYARSPVCRAWSGTRAGWWGPHEPPPFGSGRPECDAMCPSDRAAPRGRTPQSGLGGSEAYLQGRRLPGTGLASCWRGAGSAHCIQDKRRQWHGPGGAGDPGAGARADRRLAGRCSRAGHSPREQLAPGPVRRHPGRRRSFQSMASLAVRARAVLARRCRSETSVRSQERPCRSHL